MSLLISCSIWRALSCLSKSSVYSIGSTFGANGDSPLEMLARNNTMKMVNRRLSLFDGSKPMMGFSAPFTTYTVTKHVLSPARRVEWNFPCSGMGLLFLIGWCEGLRFLQLGHWGQSLKVCPEKYVNSDSKVNQKIQFLASHTYGYVEVWEVIVLIGHFEREFSLNIRFIVILEVV